VHAFIKSVKGIDTYRKNPIKEASASKHFVTVQYADMGTFVGVRGLKSE
jgi:hypothetical protein